MDVKRKKNNCKESRKMEFLKKKLIKWKTMM